MESNLHEHSKTSSCEEETDQSNEVRTGRSYECVFCKRGFTTAQALGGHMNIHRKDRTNNSSKSNIRSSPAKHIDGGYSYASLSGDSAIQSYTPAQHQEVLINYQAFFPATSHDNNSWGFRSQHAQDTDDLYVQSPQLLNHFQDDWMRNLSLQIGPSNLDLDDNKEKNEEDDDELDLELRLGHHDP
ncbi:hypothetical protein JCGZ_21804 [Jatropha curcas]|uniref:C2H2-type domain-containing protein n=1 Tax=Jatropha curcas TaxID=180498 RepID=A0A067JEZ5_JATCU|nr:transcriptional regulator SUPERMAN [Jatropha curcas]KDP21333.1 hypothetical protein JCGZ_21804 [Jatropha curcas]